MFLEPHFKGQRSGWIEVICGSMFSGKTEELIRRLKRAEIADQVVQVYKPNTDMRYSREKVVSHDQNFLHSTVVSHSTELLNLTIDAQVVGIDEAQFFDLELTGVCQQLALNGVRVIVAGLDMDYLGAPFGPMPFLLAVAEYITKVHAICTHCGNLATHSYRLSKDENQVVIGAKDNYEPRCRVCYQMGNILDLKVRKRKSSPADADLNVGPPDAGNNKDNL
ncbi:MAG: thymidine kinase [Saprospiraceae bacterium]|nr:thymidine kinase [Saprospiraceae bacterium]